jgi:hypothetical protein
MEELKAISQNPMHSTVGITDGIYGRLVEDDVHEAILGLGKQKQEEESELEQSIEKILRKILKEKELFNELPPRGEGSEPSTSRSRKVKA